MYHGATPDQDVTFIFITNKKFTIHHVGDKNDPCALEQAVLDKLLEEKKAKDKQAA